MSVSNKVTHLLITLVFVASLWPMAIDAQGRGGGADSRNLRGVLGGVPMTAADSVIKEVVGLLDFESYKSLIQGLTEFGDREQGTPRNAAAVDWIEQTLQGWGYQTARIHYDYTPRGSDVAEPREEVYACLLYTSPSPRD